MKRLTNSNWNNLPNDFGKGRLPSLYFDVQDTKDFLYRNASIIGLAIAITTMVV